MTWALPYLYIQIILHARGATEVASGARGTLLTVLVVGIVLCLGSSAVRRVALFHRTKHGMTRA